MRYLIVGDLHGVYYKLLQLEQYFDQVDKVIFVGDYVDRGPQPLEVLEYVAKVPHSVRLTGNHEWKYLKKIRKGQRVYPEPLTDADFDRFNAALNAALGPRPAFFYKDDCIAVSHAPAALYQHDWTQVPIDKFLYGWTIPNTKNEHGFPKRLTLEEKFPGEVSMKPLIYGHVHANEIIVRHNEYVVDLCCGQPDGKLGAVIIENTTLVDTIII